MEDEKRTEQPAPSVPPAEAPPVQLPAPPGYYGQTQGGQPQPQEPSTMDRIIPTKNPSALAAYYMAVFSLVPCFGFFLGPAAVVFGIKGLKLTKAVPGLPGKGHAWTGVILGGITTVVFWGVVIAVAMAAAVNPKP